MGLRAGEKREAKSGTQLARSVCKKVRYSTVLAATALALEHMRLQPETLSHQVWSL